MDMYGNQSREGITVYPRIQLFQRYSFEVAGYSAVLCIETKPEKKERLHLINHNCVQN